MVELPDLFTTLDPPAHYHVVALVNPPAGPSWLDLPALHERLLPLAQAAGHTRLVLRAEEIDWPAFEGIRKLGLTAGASAPEVLVEEIIEAFAARYDVIVDTVSTVVEDMVFPLPRELRSEAAE